MRRALGLLGPASIRWRLAWTTTASAALLQRAQWAAGLSTQAGSQEQATPAAATHHSAIVRAPTIEHALQLLNSAPATREDIPYLVAALRRAHTPPGQHNDPRERLAAEEVVRRGWQRLADLPADGLVNLLRAAFPLGLLPPEQQRAWVSAYRTGLKARGSAGLFPSNYADLLWTGAQLARTNSLQLPGWLINGTLDHLCRPGKLRRLPLNQLAALGLHARALGLRLTAEQHTAVAAAVAEKVAAGSFNGPALTTLLSLWADMEREREFNEWAANRLPTEGAEAGAADPIPGYPGDVAMAAVLSAMHAHRSKVDSMALSTTIGALGALRYMPAKEQLADFVAALELLLQGAEQAHDAAAAIIGLARLGADPGETFAAACMRAMEADGGAEPKALANTAWGLAVLERCPPERWRTLLALLQHGLRADLPAAALEKWAGQWRTAYLLVREQHGETVAPLPAELMQRGVGEARTQLAQRGASYVCAPVHVVAARVLRQVCGDSATVERLFWVQDAADSPLFLDLAVPALKFGVHLSRVSQATRNTNAQLGTATVLPRLARLEGWEVAVVPQRVLAVGKEERNLGNLGRAIRSFLLEHTRLPELLARG